MTRTVSSARSSVADRRLVRAGDNSLSLNGTSSYISTTGTAPSVNGFGFAMWLRVLSGANFKEVVDCQVTSGSQQHGFRVETAAGQKLSFSYANNTTILGLDSNPVYPLNEWFHLAATYDGTNSRLYINGVQVALRTTSGVMTATSTPLRIGATSAASPAQFIKSLFKEVVYRSTGAFTAQEVKDLYWRGKMPTGLAVRYNLDEGSSTTATDTSGNANNGTITAQVWVADTPFKARPSASGRVATP